MPYPFRLLSVLLHTALLLAIAHPQGGSQQARNPFAPPDATPHYAPDRMYDLLNLTLDLKVDYPNRLLEASATNAIAALRDGVTQLRFHAGASTKVDSVALNGKPAQFIRDAEGILVDCPPTKQGQKDVVVIHYHLKNSASGWHWHEPKKNDPSKLGLWTNGEYADTRSWAVTWDYPNDFTTSETRTTVPADWEVIGNGSLISDTLSPSRKTRTVVWRMTQPHATYLTSIVAGPFDIKKDAWRGMTLYYVAPRGMGKKLDYTCEHTKDMLSFYSDNLGVKYPWPKYAENFVYDFGGGQENVSATTFGLFFADPRDIQHGSDWILAHEMGHQWFGDYVTCKDWGQLWLNESFATWMEMSYTMHSRGAFAGLREMEQNSQGYFQESRRYKRPIATSLYSDPGVMFDQHTYPKGGVLLTSLRKMLGDKLFFAGLNRYLTTYHNSPVDTNMLCVAMTEATGVNLHPWFDQWILKPGHPVIDWSWAWDDTKKEAVVHVKQMQDIAGGTPIYDIPAKVAMLTKSGEVDRRPIHLTSADQEFRLAAKARPDSVVFDPDHDFLREIPKNPWTESELTVIAMYGPNCVDRQFAFSQMLSGKPSDATIQTAVSILIRDKGAEPAILDVSPLARLNHANLRNFWESELVHEDFGRRRAAVNALADLPSEPAEIQLLRGLINVREPYRVVAAAMAALAKLDYVGSASLIENQAKSSDNALVRGSALGILVKNNAPGATDLMFRLLQDTQPDEAQQAGMSALSEFKGDDSRLVPALRSAIKAGDFGSVFAVFEIARKRRITELLPDLEGLKKRYPFLNADIDRVIKEIKG